MKNNNIACGQRAKLTDIETGGNPFTDKQSIGLTENWQILTDDDLVLESGLSQFEAEALITRMLNEDMDVYLNER